MFEYGCPPSVFLESPPHLRADRLSRFGSFSVVSFLAVFEPKIHPAASTLDSYQTAFTPHTRFHCDHDVRHASRSRRLLLRRSGVSGAAAGGSSKLWLSSLLAYSPASLLLPSSSALYLSSSSSSSSASSSSSSSSSASSSSSSSAQVWHWQRRAQIENFYAAQAGPGDTPATFFAFSTLVS